ncbi:MAG: glycosyltransferase family 9 protein [Bacteriovoracaceae bacterium]
MRESPLYVFLDRYFGQILCFLFGFLPLIERKLRKYFSFNQDVNSKSKKVLIVEFFEMGSSMMAYHGLLELSKKIGKNNLYCLCSTTTKSSWVLIDIIPKENIYAIPSNTFSSFVLGFFSTIWKVRANSFDAIIDFGPLTRISALAATLIKSEHLSGFCNEGGEGYFRGFHYDRLVPYSQNHHAVYNFLTLMRVGSGEDPEKVLKHEYVFEEIATAKYTSRDEIKEVVLKKLKEFLKSPQADTTPLFLLGPDVGANLPQRNYPKSGYVSLIQKLLKTYPNAAVIFIGTKENEQYCQDLVRVIADARVINFCGRTATLEELLELFYLGTMYIGNDNGLQHFASMTTVPFISFFGVETPGVYGPLGNGMTIFQNFVCSPCVTMLNHKSTKCSNNLCLSTIPVENIMQSIDMIFQGKGRARTINNRDSYLYEREIKIISAKL